MGRRGLRPGEVFDVHDEAAGLAAEIDRPAAAQRLERPVEQGVLGRVVLGDA